MMKSKSKTKKVFVDIKNDKNKKYPFFSLKNLESLFFIPNFTALKLKKVL